MHVCGVVLPGSILIPFTAMICNMVLCICIWYCAFVYGIVHMYMVLCICIWYCAYVYGIVHNLCIWYCAYVYGIVHLYMVLCICA